MVPEAVDGGILRSPAGGCEIHRGFLRWRGKRQQAWREGGEGPRRDAERFVGGGYGATKETGARAGSCEVVGEGTANPMGISQAACTLLEPVAFAQWAQMLVELSELRGRAAGEAAGFVKGEAAGIAKGFVKGEAAGIAKGEAQGKAAAILAVLGARGVHVSDEARARIEACEDGSLLDRWIVRATTAPSVEDVFSAA
jgi:hypothetical protein